MLWQGTDWVALQLVRGEGFLPLQTALVGFLTPLVMLLKQTFTF